MQLLVCLSGHMFHRGEDVFPMVVYEVSTILKFKGLCELGVCDLRCTPRKVTSVG
jgi:hypothetical protein